MYRFLALLFLFSGCVQHTTPTRTSVARKETLQPLTILKEALESRNTNEQILALQAIGVSMNDEAHGLIQPLAPHDAPEVELTKVQVLSTIGTDEAEFLLKNELRSDLMLIRLEALFALATRRAKECFYHLEAEFSKIDPHFQYLFPELFGMEHSAESKKFLKSLLHHPDPSVRSEAVFTLAKSYPDELLSEIHYLRRDPYPAIQEMLVTYLLQYRAHNFPIDEFLHKVPAGRLIQAETESNQKVLEEEAARGNLFAITSKLSRSTLLALQTHQDIQIQLNATVALLEARDPNCLTTLPLLFCQDQRDFYFERIYSPGKSLTAYRAGPSAHEQFRRIPGLYERDMQLRFQWLQKAVELPEECFLAIARRLFKTEQKELILLLCRLLENVRSEKAIELLEAEAEHFGSPFIRQACTLSLFRLGISGPYAERLLRWIKEVASHDLLKPRPTLPWSVKETEDRFTLSFEETSQLLVDSYEALSESHRQEAKAALEAAIREGNPNNRPLLAALLLRTRAH